LADEFEKGLSGVTIALGRQNWKGLRVSTTVSDLWTWGGEPRWSRQSNKPIDSREAKWGENTIGPTMSRETERGDHSIRPDHCADGLEGASAE
jgi:hypothetical protein